MNPEVVPETTYNWSRDSDLSQYCYLWDPIIKVIEEEKKGETHIFDLGCGNGLTAAMMVGRGFEVTGVDPCEQGVALAKERCPRATFDVASGYEDLADRFGQFPIVICMEVIEHCYYPKRLAKTLYDLIAPSGLGVMTTPYHGYLKNFAISITGKWDWHFGALSDGGHIKFLSVATLRQILTEVGFSDMHFLRVGRVPPLAKSMIAVVRK